MSLSIDGMNAVTPDGRFRFGQFDTPFTSLDFHLADLSDVSAWWGRPQRGWLGRTIRRMRLKKWHYFSVTHPDLYLCAAIADVGYMGNTFCYLVDRRSGRKFETESLRPLGWGMRVGHTSRSETLAPGMRITFSEDHWVCELDLSLQGKPLKAGLSFQAGPPLCLLYPLHDNRGAYTHKEIGEPCSGWVDWDNQAFAMDEAFGALDYTHSYADRRTDWKWLFLTGHLVDGRRFGLNLSELLYGDAENCLWLDGGTHALGEVHFESPNDGPWRIAGEQVDLEFQPFGKRQQDVNLFLVSSAFIQPYGEATGILKCQGETLKVASAFGVAEDHQAVW